MAVRRNKRTRRDGRRLLRAVKGGHLRRRKDAQAADAPDAAANDYRAGVLRFDSESWRLPKGLMEAGEPESKGRVMLVITILAVVFIAIMAWFVSKMPAK